eukprot:gnl/TRDRNA2_/TRDRNA2_181169_c0_seq1.p1 gnl/TRDRNA2_/TRDRNA2_181169_c0~~gnl/TRDRNA2_/TRDRNA2_181169_c0_seq1.p1  ORF type:complete len:289 (-),score=57.89 gnl/TRDRNA2_/TRDRNA2_181169_c0_seq1:126-992(-)
MLSSANATPSAKALSAMKSNSPPSSVMAAYVAFFGVALFIYHFIAEGEFSSILTMAVMFQCLGFCLLSAQVLINGSAHGISGRSLGLEVLSIVLRLSSTTWLNGYLPVDASGDWIYQMIDVTSLGLVCWLLYHVVVESQRSYQMEKDDLPVLPLILGGLVLAALLHADMNSRPLFDAAWMAGLNIGCVAVLPQLWIVAKNGGKVDTLTSHFIMAMAVSRLLSGTFMWHARFDITCDMWFGEINHAIWAILAAHAVNLLLLGDFGYYYLKAVFSQGLLCKMSVEGEFAV